MSLELKFPAPPIPPAAAGAQTRPGQGMADARIRQHQLTALQRNTPFIVLGSLLVAMAQWWVLDGVVPRPTLLIWLGLLALHSVARLALWRWLSRRRDRSTRVGEQLRAHTLASLASGLLWAGGATVFLQYGQVEHRLLVIFMLAGMVSSSLHSQTVHLPAFYAFFLPCVVGSVGGSLWLGGTLYRSVAFAVFAYSVLTVRFARTLNGQLVESLQARFEIADLADRLRVQKEAAEQANLAKSRFLAAASHDLRQPVHTLSLLIGTLESQHLDALQRQVVEHIGAAVRTMSRLFSSLLDISRLDAGVVTPEVAPVPLRAILERLTHEAQPLAAAKGLQLRTHCANAIVRSDPLLLERILRNLLSNAIRYTDHGRVVLGCRRRGPQLEIQIWDTGSGIAEAQQQRIFQEFVQLSPPSPDRQGIGLGLAIVKRLTTLLDHPLRLRSRPGRGSMFGVTVPLAEGTPLQPSAQRLTSAPPAGGLVLVLDDDPEIGLAMRLLLSGWGFEVLTACSLAELLKQVADVRTCPVALISDYGLGTPENGLQAIVTLREEFNAEIPAILITGNTTPERLRETAAAGHQLLHKPVAPDRLRQALTTLLERPSASA